MSTENEVKHTPGVMEVVEFTNSPMVELTCFSEDENQSHSDCVAYMNHEFSQGVMKANAKRMALAWNSHDALVEALQNLIDAEDAFVCQSGCEISDPVSDAVEKARIALTLAQPEKEMVTE